MNTEQALNDVKRLLDAGKIANAREVAELAILESQERRREARERFERSVGYGQGRN